VYSQSCILDASIYLYVNCLLRGDVLVLGSVEVLLLSAHQRKSVGVMINRSVKSAAAKPGAFGHGFMIERE